MTWTDRRCPAELRQRDSFASNGAADRQDPRRTDSPQWALRVCTDDRGHPPILATNFRENAVGEHLDHRAQRPS